MLTDSIKVELWTNFRDSNTLKTIKVNVEEARRSQGVVVLDVVWFNQKEMVRILTEDAGRLLCGLENGIVKSGGSL
jgi:hypothetical protein